MMDELRKPPPDEDLPPVSLAEEAPEIAAFLAEPDLDEPSPDLFDGMEILQDVDIETADPETVNEQLRQIWESEEGERPIDEVVGEISARQDQPETDIEEGSPAADGSGDLLSGFSGGLSGLGMAVGGAAVLAAGVGAAAVLAGKLRDKPAEPSRPPETFSWYYSHNGQQTGPVLQNDIRDWLATGRLPADTYVWREGLNEWQTAGQAGLLPPPVVEQKPEPVAAPVQAAPAATGWYYGLGGQTIGPVTESAVRDLLKAGQLAADTPLWREGMAAWSTAAAAGLVDVPPAPPEPPVPPVQPLPPAPPVQNPAAAACVHCGAALKPGARFCGKCGQKQ